jgi:ribosomal protein L24
MCNEEISTETHHLMQQKEADERGIIDTFHKNHNANLMALCEKCHQQIHKSEKKVTIKKKTIKPFLNK